MESKNLSAAPSKKSASGKTRAPRKREANIAMTGAPCVNCNQYMGTHEPAFTAPGFQGRSHEICIRSKAMPLLAKRAFAIIEACERKSPAYGRAREVIDAFREATATDKLRKMQTSEFAKLLTDTFTNLYFRCTNGLSGMQPQIVEFAIQARRRLFCEVTVVPPDSPDFGVVGKAKASAKRSAK